MSGGMRLFAVVVGLCGVTVACGGGTDSSLVGPSAIGNSPVASTGTGGGSTGGVDVSGTIRVVCEQRSGRSKVSVDGNNLRAGTYQARISSGPNQARSAARPSIGDEVEFDFDSNPNDVAAGATSIANTFIQGGQVQGELLDVAGVPVATATVGCSVR